MLEISKVKFSEEAHDYQDVTYVRGGIALSVSVAVDDSGGVPRTAVHDNIREAIWRKAYDDPMDPLMELQHFALRYAPTQHTYRVEELCKQCAALA